VRRFEAVSASCLLGDLGMKLPLRSASAQGMAPSPVLGTNAPIDPVPRNVQTLTAPQLENFHPWSLLEALQNNRGSVSLSDTEGNPLHRLRAVALYQCDRARRPRRERPRSPTGFLPRR
jgi:hypothetical protein